MPDTPKPARFFDRLDENRVQCQTCAHGCKLKPGQRGICGVMENRDGALVTLIYGKIIALHDDPIEKKPLFHFLPGSRICSVASVGCNFRCANCQNSDIAQMPRDEGRIAGKDLSPESLVETAVQHKCDSIAYTYTEPAVFVDYALDTAKIAKDRGLANVLVTNGFFSEESAEAAALLMDAANIDLKAFRDETYRDICGGRLEPVLRTIRKWRAFGMWIEVTTLLIPGLNDSDGELSDIAGFIRDVDPDIPWHVSRFHPSYRMTDRPTTPVETIRKARKIGLDAGLHFVYAGNVPGDEGERTACPSCKKIVIKRMGFEVVKNSLNKGSCPFCGTALAGVWEYPSKWNHHV
jgi:pyruvate formate lyase activating enzyme